MAKIIQKQYPTPCSSPRLINLEILLPINGRARINNKTSQSYKQNMVIIHKITEIVDQEITATRPIEEI